MEKKSSFLKLNYSSSLFLFSLHI